MEEVKEEVETKEESKVEHTLPPIESGADVENIISTIKKDGLIEALVQVAKEEKPSVKFESETKPSILTSLVKRSRGRDVKTYHNYLELMKSEVKVKPEVENDGDKITASEETVEDVFPENDESVGPEGDFRDLAYLKSIPNNISTPLQENPVRAKKVYKKERKYMCRYCDKGFPQSDILSRHIKTHTGERPYECSCCWKRFISKSLLDRHMSNHIGKLFGCSICGKRFFQSQGLKTHMLIHEGKKPFKCAHCDIAFREKTSLLRHIKSIHVRSQENAEMRSDREKLNLSEGLEPDHSVQRQVNSNGLNRHFKCNDCGKTFTSRDNIIGHMKNVHIQEYRSRYCCRVCGKTSKTKSNLKKHEQLHEDVYPFKCELCNMSFKQNISLKMHYRQAHESGKPYKCGDCGSCFKTKENLLSHNEVHHNKMGTEYPCHICHMVFKRKCYLKRHVQTHSGVDKKYVCDDCGLGCRSKTDIAKHVLTHLGASERPHVCEVCGAAFMKRSHVVRHRRVHSEERTFRCELCDKGYKDTASLKMHRETVHFGASFSCKGCGFSSTNRQSFNRHLRKCQD